MGSPSLLRRDCRSSESAWPGRRRDFRCCIPGCARCRLHFPVSWLQASGSCCNTPLGVHRL
eukprot:2611904-Pyramimonas_sp.AAC.1